MSRIFSDVTGAVEEDDTGRLADEYGDRNHSPKFGNAHSADPTVTFERADNDDVSNTRSATASPDILIEITAPEEERTAFGEVRFVRVRAVPTDDYLFTVTRIERPLPDGRRVRTGHRFFPSFLRLTNALRVE